MRIQVNADGSAVDLDTGAILTKGGSCNWRAKGPMMQSTSYVNEATGETYTVVEQVEDAPYPLEPV